DANSGAGCDWNSRCDPEEPRLVSGSGTETCAYVGAANYDVTTVIGASSCQGVAASHGAGGTSCGEGPALTPPPRDCFGCCELPARSGTFVFIGTRDAAGVRTCTFEEAQTGGAGCRACTPVSTCQNECDSAAEGDECRLCLGETELPDHCTAPTDGGTPPPSCPGGQTTCAPISDNVCGTGETCFFGCCIIDIGAG